MGVMPGWRAVGRLMSIVGRANALKLLGTSKPLPAGEKAVSIGYADEVLEEDGSSDADENHIESAVKFLEPYVVAQPFPDAVRCIKRAVAAADVLSTAEARAVELQMFAQRWQSNDNKSALHKK